MTDTVDTPESVRALVDDLDKIVTDGMDAHLFTVNYDAFAGVFEALTRYAALLEQVAAHNKCCAGVWVKGEERDPKKGLHWTTCVVDWDESPRQGETWFDGLSWLTSNDARVTHWLDARMPGEER